MGFQAMAPGFKYVNLRQLLNLSELHSSSSVNEVDSTYLGKLLRSLNGIMYRKQCLVLLNRCSKKKRPLFISFYILKNKVGIFYNF